MSASLQPARRQRRAHQGIPHLLTAGREAHDHDARIDVHVVERRVGNVDALAAGHTSAQQQPSGPFDL
jgi:hypothetical protein